MEIDPLDYTSIPQIKETLKKFELAPRKEWGQNYLVNLGACQRIVSLLELKDGEGVWEIGPGLGALTHLLITNPISLTLFEIDPGYCRFLQETLLQDSYPDKKSQTNLIAGDFLKEFEAEWHRKPPTKLVGNLPYNLASHVIATLIKGERVPEQMLFTIQKELGERIVSPVGKKEYSSLSVLCQWGCEVRKRVVLKPNSFYPVPRVDSLVIELKPRKKREDPKDLALFFLLVKGLFHSRRKTIRNNLGLFIRHFEGVQLESLIEEAKLDKELLATRAERLSVSDFVQLSDQLGDQLSKYLPQTKSKPNSKVDSPKVNSSTDSSADSSYEESF